MYVYIYTYTYIERCIYRNVKICQIMSKHLQTWLENAWSWGSLRQACSVHALSAVQDTVGSSLGQPIGSTWPQIAADGSFTARGVAMM